MVPFTRGYAHVRKHGRGVEKEGQHQVPTRWVCLMHLATQAKKREGGSGRRQPTSPCTALEPCNSEMHLYVKDITNKRTKGLSTDQPPSPHLPIRIYEKDPGLA